MFHLLEDLIKIYHYFLFNFFKREWHILINNKMNNNVNEFRLVVMFLIVAFPMETREGRKLSCLPQTKLAFSEMLRKSISLIQTSL